MDNPLPSCPWFGRRHTDCKGGGDVLTKIRHCLRFSRSTPRGDLCWGSQGGNAFGLRAARESIVYISRIYISTLGVRIRSVGEPAEGSFPKKNCTNQPVWSVTILFLLWKKCITVGRGFYYPRPVKIGLTCYSRGLDELPRWGWCPIDILTFLYTKV